MDRLFYIIYNSYYNHGKGTKSSEPVGAVYALFFVALLSLFLCFHTAGYLISDPNHFVNKKPTNFRFVCLILSILANYFLFYRKKRYLVIYETYHNVAMFETLLYRSIGFITITILICSPFILALLYNKIHFGYWV